MGGGNINGDVPQQLLKIHSFYKDLDPLVSPFLRATDAIKAAVLQKILKPGGQVPSTGNLAKQIGINHMTAVKALQKVASLGIIRGSRGSNYIVCEDGLKICSEMIEGEVRDELRHIHRKMTLFRISRNRIGQWLRGFEDADKSIESATQKP